MKTIISAIAIVFVFLACTIEVEAKTYDCSTHYKNKYEGKTPIEIISLDNYSSVDVYVRTRHSGKYTFTHQKDGVGYYVSPYGKLEVYSDSVFITEYVGSNKITHMCHK